MAGSPSSSTQQASAGRGRGRGRGRGVAFGGGGFGIRGAEDNSKSWTAQDVASANKALQSVFSVLFNDAAMSPIFANAMSNTAKSAQATLLYVAAVEMVGKYAGWLREHSAMSPALAAGFLVRCISTRSQAPATGSAVGGGSPTVGNRHNLQAIGVAASAAFAQLTVSCCQVQGGDPAKALCHISVMQPLVFQFLGLPAVAPVRFGLSTLKVSFLL